MAKPDDFLNLLATYLEANGVTAVKTGVQPAKPANCTSLVGLAGTTLTTSRDVPGLQFPRFQAIVRNTSYEQASLQFQALREALHGKIGLILPVGANVVVPPAQPVPYIRILRLHVEQEGGPIGEDDNGRYEFVCNFIGEFHNVATA